MSRKYNLQHPYKGPLADSRIAAIKSFSDAVRLCNTEMADQERLAFWQKEFARYNHLRTRLFFPHKELKQYTTLRGFIIARLSAQKSE